MSSFLDALKAVEDKKNGITLVELKSKLPNDQDLGEYVRFNYDKIIDLSYTETQKIVNANPNDFMLGEEIRRI